MRVLVTGGAGYIGSHTAQKLLNAGHEVFIYDNLTTGFSEALPKKAQFIMGDVRDSIMLARVMKDKKIEAVVHFAAVLIVHESLAQPLDYYENNTGGVISLLKACRQQKIDKVIFSSTAAVYGDATASGVVDENSTIAPLNPYGSSKYMSEQILRDADIAYGIRSVALRYFNVAGAAQDGLNGPRTHNASHLVKVAAEAACGKRAGMSVFGTDYPTPDGTCIRDYIHIEDLANLHVEALRYLEAGNATTVFNCGYGRGFSVQEVITTLKKVSGRDFTVEKQGRRGGDAAKLVANSAKAREVLKWTPEFDSLEMICSSAFEWEKKI